MLNGSAPNRSISRRSFLKTSAAVAGVAAATSMPLTALAKEYVYGQKETASTKIYHCVCRPNCNNFCNINVHVRDGKVVKTSKAWLKDNMDVSRICHRGLTHVERIYGAGRLQYPLRRAEGTAPGAGEWERISWDEAITEISDQIKRIRSTYGDSSVAVYRGTGNYGSVVAGAGSRFVNAINATTVGPCNDLAPYLAQARLMGVGNIINEPRDMMNAKNIVLHGSNISEAQMHNYHWLKTALMNGTKLTVVDPVFTVIASKADYFVPVRPGTDYLLYMATSYNIVTRGLVNYEFMAKNTIAPFLVREDNGMFLRKSFVDNEGQDIAMEMGEAQGIMGGDGNNALVTLSAAVSPEDDPYVVIQDGELMDFFTGTTPQLEGEVEVFGVKCRTAYSILLDEIMKYAPEKVAADCGLSVEQIDRYTEVCLDGPVYHLQGYGEGNQVGGVHTSIAGYIHVLLIGNWGKPGATYGGCYPSFPLQNWGWPVVAPATSPTVQEVDLQNAITAGKFNGQDLNIKFLYVYDGNPVSTSENMNRYYNTIRPALDFMVVADTALTDTACIADIVLPSAQHFEIFDWVDCASQFAVAINERAIEPPYEAKGDAEIFRLMAEKLGVGEYFQKTEEEIAKETFETQAGIEQGLTLENLKAKKYIRYIGPETYISYPQGSRFDTNSGRIEFYIESPAPRAAVTYPPTEEQIMSERSVHFYPAKETWNKDPKYPLTLMSVRGRYRVHSQYFAVSILNELDPEPKMYVNPADAIARGIADDSYAEAFNDRGHAVARVVYSQGVQKGTILYPKSYQRCQHKAGAWNELLHGDVDPFSIANNFQDSACDIRPWIEGSEQ